MLIQYPSFLGEFKYPWESAIDITLCNNYNIIHPTSSYIIIIRAEDL